MQHHFVRLELQVVFDHKQNVFTIEFATLDMRSPEKYNMPIN